MGGGASALDHPEAVAALKRVEALEEQVKALTAALEATAVTARATDSAPPEGDAGAAGAEAGASGKHKVFPGTVDVEDITDMSVDALWALLRDFSVTDPWSKAGLAMELVSGSNDVGATRKVVITLPDGVVMAPLVQQLTKVDDAARVAEITVLSHPTATEHSGLLCMPDGSRTTWVTKCTAAEGAEAGRAVCKVHVQFVCDSEEHRQALAAMVTRLYTRIIHLAFRNGAPAG